MTDKSLREVIAETWYDSFYSAKLENATLFRAQIAHEVTDAILAALHDFVPTEAMINAWCETAQVYPDDGVFCRAEWRAMIHAGMEER